MFNITNFTCRICLQEKDVLINVYDELEELNTNLSNLLLTCVDLQINENDMFPKYLCADCTRELLITSKFHEKCNKSKEVLYELSGKISMPESKEFNSSDFIEYCTEEIDETEIDDLIIQEFSSDEEGQPAQVIEVETEYNSSLSNEELMQNSELHNQSKQYDNMIEEVAFSDSCIGQSETTSNLGPIEENIIPLKVCSKTTASTIQTLGEKSKRNHIFKCDVCGVIFKQAINLKKHFQKLHETIQCYTCSICDYCFSLEIEYYKHVDGCKGLENGEEIKTYKKSSTAVHSAADRSLDSERSRKCVYCDRSFATPFALRMHLRTHTGERPFQCKYCTKSFKTQSQLNVHHKRHIGQADFVCTICNKTFYEQSNLIVHMRSHTGERPHVCTICNKTFTRVFLLQFHMRTHTGEKPFKCSYCDKNFRQYADLRSHLAIHTGQKQHACISCGKSYIKRSHLLQHMRKHPYMPNNPEIKKTLYIEEDHITSADKSVSSNDDTNSKVLYNLVEIMGSENVVTHSNNM